MLERVGHPVALNPSPHMVPFAKRHKYALIKKNDRILDKLDEVLAQSPHEIRSFEVDEPEPETNRANSER